MAEIDPRFVKHGLWTNLEKGPVMGQTITTDIRTATIVVAMLTLLCTFGTSHLWNLLVFFWHQSRAHGRPKDGLFHQQQAILRTLPPPTTLMTDSIKLGWYWRKRADHVFTRCSIQAVVALFFAVTAACAGILSAYVVDTSNIEVLVSSKDCGLINVTALDASTNYASSSTSYWSKVDSLARDYATECYQDLSSVPTMCQSFTKPRVYYETKRVSCPFAPSICALDDLPGIMIDSGLVDLNDQFGLNLPSAKGVKFRKATTCAVLAPENRDQVIFYNQTTDLLDRQSFPGEQVYIVSYGTNLGMVPSPWSNVTFQLSLTTANATGRYSTWNIANYAPPAWTADATIDVRGYLQPVSELMRDDADIVLISKSSNAIRYMHPVNDPLFSAHTIGGYQMEREGGNISYYHTDIPTTVLGCAQQYQVCFSRGSQDDLCTDLSGLTNIMSKTLPGALPGTSDVQQAVLRLLTSLSLLADQSMFKSFNASNFLSPPYSGDLPDDQWAIEAVTAESYVWACFQVMMADYAIGPNSRAFGTSQFVNPPLSAGEKQLCRSQKMRKPGGLANINLFGLVFIITISVTVALVDICILKFLIYLSNFRRALSPRIERWIQVGVLQLQRRAYEAQDQGTWSHLVKDVPVTAPGQKLSDLPIETLPKAPKGFGFRRSDTQDTKVSLAKEKWALPPSTTLGQEEWENLEMVITKEDRESLPSSPNAPR